MYKYIHIHICMYIFIYIINNIYKIYICLCIYIFIYINIYTHTHTHIYIYLYMHVYNIYVYIQYYIYIIHLDKIYIYIYIYIIYVYIEMMVWEFFLISTSQKQKERKNKQLKYLKNGLSITIQCNLKSMDFLDITFALYNSLYKQYRKPNNKPIYINKQSNNFPNVLKQLPKSIAKIISDTTSSKNIFDKSISFYQNALFKSDFKEGLKYTRSDKSFQEENGQRTRRRKIIWFNPPYSRSVKTNISTHQ